MGVRQPLRPGELEEAQRLRDSGLSWQNVSRALGRTSKEFYPCYLVPGFRETLQERARLNKQNRVERQRAKPDTVVSQKRDKLTPAEARKAAELRRNGYRVQGIAAILRAPYRVVEACLEGLR